MSLLDLLQSSTSKYADLAKIIVPSLDEAKKRIGEIDASPGEVWGDRSTSVSLTKERTRLVELVEKMGRWSKGITDDIEMVEAFGEEAVIGELLGAAEKRMKEMEGFEVLCLFKGENDHCAALMTITSGAGGDEAKNWCQMLLRMYLRYCANAGYTVELLDEKVSDTNSDMCLDNASIRISGGDDLAYGWFKNESGVMRLIRQSPFSSGGARHTSFAAVSVLPDIEDSVSTDVVENDLEITTMRGSGSGGQSINKIESAVRIRHIPTGIVINSRAESSQHQNRRAAMKMLKAKLYDLEVQKKNAERDRLADGQSVVAFGSQIRTWTLSPFQLCKDHRSEWETSQAEKVLEGDIRGMLEASLRVM